MNILNKQFTGFLIILFCLTLSEIIYADPINITMYKQAGCMCCDKHAEILEQEGFDVQIVEKDNLNLLKTDLDIPEEFKGCHTMIIDRYIVEGHVPGNLISKLLDEQPDIRGISLPGMPVGSPGMPGERSKPLDVYIIEKDKKTTFAQF